MTQKIKQDGGHSARTACQKEDCVYVKCLHVSEWCTVNVTVLVICDSYSLCSTGYS